MVGKNENHRQFTYLNIGELPIYFVGLLNKAVSDWEYVVLWECFLLLPVGYMHPRCKRGRDNEAGTNTTNQSSPNRLFDKANFTKPAVFLASTLFRRFLR